jgi:hypothetical protein
LLGSTGLSLGLGNAHPPDKSEVIMRQSRLNCHD